MTGKTETRVREIGRRTRQYRKRYETRLLSCLTACSLFLLAGIGVLFRSVQTPGVAAVADGYGAVLLRDGAVTYVVIGIAAFVVGVSVTVLCIRLKTDQQTVQTVRKEATTDIPAQTARGYPGGGLHAAAAGMIPKTVRQAEEGFEAPSELPENGIFQRAENFLPQKGANP